MTVEIASNNTAETVSNNDQIFDNFDTDHKDATTGFVNHGHQHGSMKRDSVAMKMAAIREIQMQLPPKTCPFSGAISQRNLKVTNFASNTEQFDTLHKKAITDIACKNGFCFGSMMAGMSESRAMGTMRPREEIMAHAKLFFDEYYESMNMANGMEHKVRLANVMNDIETIGTYDHTSAELEFGAKLAWRNAPRCIGRIQWNRLQLFDCRKVRNTQQMFKAIIRHIKEATNDGNIKSTITVFPKRTDGKPDFKVWNSQLISYAGYLQPDGTYIGDPARAKFTEICQALGWEGKGTAFDVLPLVLSASGEDPQYFDIPSEIVMEVDIKHPKFPWFEEMGLRWYVLPAVANMMLDCGGIEYPAAPFNGWYMSTEIGTRDFCDPQRYDILEDVAIKMGLDTSTPANLWKDLALVEVNIAVLYSFQLKTVTIMDHHTASESFIKHMENEQKLRGGCPSDWVWIVPPMSGGITPVFHQEMINYNLKPSYEYQDPAWKTHVWIDKDLEAQIKGSGRKIRTKAAGIAMMFCLDLIKKCLGKRIKVTVLYATETGKSETYGKRIAEIMKRAFNSEVKCMEKYDPLDLINEKMVLVVTSTFGSGDAPDNGKVFAKKLAALVANPDPNNNMIMTKSNYPSDNLPNGGGGGNRGGLLSNTRFAVFALGSTAYPDFCEFGKFCDSSLYSLGGQRVMPVATGDELQGQDQSFKKWTHQVLKATCESFNIKMDMSAESLANSINEQGSWTPDSFRLLHLATAQEVDLIQGLTNTHKKNVAPVKMVSKRQLQSQKSDRQTILAKFNTRGSEKMSYAAGDHLAIFAANKSEQVMPIVKRVKNAPSVSEVLSIQELDREISRGKNKSWKQFNRIPSCTIISALTHYLDINTPPSQEMLQYFVRDATDPDDKRRLQKLATDSDSYEQWKNWNFPNLMEVLEEFPSLRPDASMLLTQLPLLQPRFYSISSSPFQAKNEIHATIGVVNYRTQGGKGPVHLGLCSNYVNSFPNEDIPCFIRKAPIFHLPEDRELPIVMVGPGTGIAPFRGFWQQRVHELKEEGREQVQEKIPWFRRKCGSSAVLKDTGFGKMSLYFGCRSPDQDDIYKDETDQLVQARVLHRVSTAYSREAGKQKKYVQHLIREDGALLFKQLSKEKGHFYLCGEAAMAADVRATLKKVFQVHGAMSVEKAEELFQEMKDNGRFHEDIFGVLVRPQVNQL